MTDHQKPRGTDSAGHRSLVIGLTGGIGSGKSTVARYFSDLGITVVDADLLARELVTPDQPAFAEIVAAFGARTVTTGGTLDRDYLRRKIYSDPVNKQKLEAILHPRIRRRMQDQLAAAKGPYCIAVIPLLLETAQTDLVDRLLVIDLPESVQHERVAERDGLSDTAISNIMTAQANRSMRLAAADDIINNDHDLDTLRARVDELHRHYLELAHGRDLRTLPT